MSFWVKIVAACFLFQGFVGTVQAAPDDGFILTQWGRWTIPQAVRAIDDAARIGARNITVLVHLCQDTRTSSDLRWCEAAPGEPLLSSFQGERLRQLLPEVRTRGLHFNFIPMVQAGGLDSRQWIFPDNGPAWFRNYGDRMEELAWLAQKEGASSFIVASELTLLFLDAKGWRDVIHRIRPIYGGHLTISPVFAQYPLIRFWKELDSIGVSAYFPLAINDGLTPIFLLEAAWRAQKAPLLAFASLYDLPVIFVEVGYPTTDVAATRPWDYNWSKRKYDEKLPTKCWEAFRRVWGDEPRLRAFQIWGVSGQPGEEPKAYSPMGKAAEPVVEQIFRQRARL
ncbi:hypothetical protein WDW37_04375 [Bdellovibrionota bacterium FG-1]